MKKIIFLICAVWLFSASLTTTKKELKNTSYKIARMNKKLDALASEIIKKQNEIEKIEKKLNLLLSFFKRYSLPSKLSLSTKAIITNPLFFKTLKISL